ncbi:hypothetical protein LTS18_007155, partial [Coniosporium uncinatum]
WVISLRNAPSRAITARFSARTAARWAIPSYGARSQQPRATAALVVTSVEAILARLPLAAGRLVVLEKQLLLAAGRMLVPLQPTAFG